MNNNFRLILEIFLISSVALMWLYVAARMITRAIIRSIQEWKERKKNG